jgi:hypothetical protein
MDNRVTIVMLAFLIFGPASKSGAESVLPHTGISSGVGRARRSGRRGGRARYRLRPRARSPVARRILDLHRELDRLLR